MAALFNLSLVASTPPAATAQDQPGRVVASNRVLELDGSGAHVELPVAAFEGLSEATVEAWVRWDSWDFFSQWFAFSTEDVWRSLGVNHFSRSPILQFFIYTGTWADLNVIGVQAAVELGTWHHMAVVSGADGMHLYLDGSPMGSHRYRGSFADLGAGTQAFLGRSPWDDNAPMRGALDEVRLWSVARNVHEIRGAMGSRMSGDEPGLAGLWNFDAGDARDASGNGHHGLLREGARCVPAPPPGAARRPWPALVHGTVVDEDGEPVVNARVRLTSAEAAVEASSAADGTFAVAVFAPGVFKVEVFGEGLRVPPRAISIAAGAEVRVVLRPSPPNLIARWPGERHSRDEVDGHDAIGDVGYAPGVVGQAFRLGGQAALRVSNAPELNPRGSFSLLAWILPEGGEAMAVMDMWGYRGSWSVDRAYALRVEPGRRLTFLLADSLHQEDGAYHQLSTRPNVLPLNAWSLVAAVWDSLSGERRIYVNGLLVARRADPPAPIARSRADLGIGFHMHAPDIWSGFFAGRIDETSIYGVALSEERIARLYSEQAEARWPAEGNANDATRSGHDGVAVGDVRFEPGMIGEAFAFDGRDSYVEFDPRIGNYGSEEFSIELWIQPQPGAGRRRHILVKGDAAAATMRLALDEAGHVEMGLADGRDSLLLVGGEALTPGTWHHVVVVREELEARLYVDGALDASATSSTLIDVRTPRSLLLGGLPQGGSFPGRIDEVSMHRWPLAAGEIQTTYKRVEADRRRRIWHSRLQTWGIVAAVLLAVLASARAVSVRRAHRRERQQLAEARRAREAADAASEAKSAFFANMSHEIRTPMNAIMGHAQALEDDPDADVEQRRRSITAIREHSGILLAMIEDILNLSKAEAGRMELQVSEFDLGALVASLHILFEVRCRQKGLHLQIVSGGALGRVRGDETKLRQVLVNLLGNAVKFTDEGQVVLSVTASDEAVRFEVSDTGPGISPELQQAIFEPFMQGASGLTKGGTGLGLAIAQRHVDLMGGQLELASSDGEGVRFWFTLPLPRIRPEPSEPVPVAAPRSVEPVELPVELHRNLLAAARMHNLTEIKRGLEQMRRLGERERTLADDLSRSVQRFDLQPLIDTLEGLEG